MGSQTVFSLNCWKLEFEIAMHWSFHGEKSIQGGGLSQIHYNLYFIYITMERLQAWGSVETNQREGIIYCTVGGRHDTRDSLQALRKDEYH